MLVYMGLVDLMLPHQIAVHKAEIYTSAPVLGKHFFLVASLIWLQLFTFRFYARRVCMQHATWPHI